MLIAVITLILDGFATLNTYKALSKKKYRKAKIPYIILSVIYYLITLTYIYMYYQLVKNGLSINKFLWVFTKLLILISFLFDASLKLSMYSSIKKISKKGKK